MFEVWLKSATVKLFEPVNEILPIKEPEATVKEVKSVALEIVKSVIVASIDKVSRLASSK